MLEHLQCFPELGEIKIHALKVCCFNTFMVIEETFSVNFMIQGSDILAGKAQRTLLSPFRFHAC